MRNYNSSLHPRISLELSQDISDSAARSSPPLSTYEDQTVVMETDVYSRWRKDEIGTTPALIKVLSSHHSFPDISINSNAGDWRLSMLLFSPRSHLAPVPPLAHDLCSWTGLLGTACRIRVRLTRIS